MENREIFKKLIKTSDIETALYLSQISLELSGDIEKIQALTKKQTSQFIQKYWYSWYYHFLL